MTQQAVQPDTAIPATGSTLAYLFADRFVLKEQPGKSGMTAYGTGEVVVTMELSAGLVAIALWQLRERGVVTLERYSGKRLMFFSVNGVRIGLTGQDPGPLHGVEKVVLAHLQKSKRGREGRETAFDVANMISRDGDPRDAVTRVAIADAVELGYLDRVKQDVGVVGRIKGKGTALEPHADLVAALDPAAQQLAAAWRDFRTREVEVAELLRSTTYDGIAAVVRARQSE
jgi:hypothetical protein